jgi:hypothetical protein
MVNRKRMNHKEKCDFLYRLIDFPDQVEYEHNNQIVAELAQDRSPLIRGLVAKALFDYPNGSSKSILLKLSKDKDDLVRVEAADSLKAHVDNVVYTRLLQMAEQDYYYLVRAYAVCSLSVIRVGLESKSLSTFVEERLNKERHIINKIMCTEALYRLGQDDALVQLMDFFKSRNYKNQCAVIHSLTDVLSKKNYGVINDFVRDLSSKDLPISIRSTLENLQDDLRKLDELSQQSRVMS